MAATATLKELREKRTELYGQIKKLADEFNENGKAWKDGQKENWEKANADYDGVMAQIQAAESAASVYKRLADIEELNKRPIDTRQASGGILGYPDANGQTGIVGGRQTLGKPTEEDRALALQGWCRAQFGKRIEETHFEAAQRTGISLHAPVLEFALPTTAQFNRLQKQFARTREENRAGFADEYNGPLTTGTPSTGGNLIPPETLIRQLDVNMLAFGGVRQVAETIITASGEPLSWPTANDTGNAGRLIAESTAADDNAAGGSSGDFGPNPSFSKVTWNAFKFTSDTIGVPYELLQDSAFDLPGILGAMLGERIGRITNTYLTTGTDTNEPQGIVTGASLGVTSASASDLLADEVIDLEHSIDPAYRNGAGYMFHDTTLLFLRKLKDQEGRYLWQSGFNTGTPDRLNNRPFTINQDMAEIDTSEKVMLFGQLYKMKIRRVGTIRLYRLQERYREKDQDGFVAFLREDGGVLSAGTAPIKYLRMGAGS